MALRLGQAVERIQNRRHREKANRCLDRINQHNEGEIRNAIVKSREEMGSAIGMYLPNESANNNIHFREDALHDLAELETTGHHEKEHAAGNKVEGLAERRANKLAGTRPTGKLVKQVQAADQIVSRLGEAKTYELARKDAQGPVLLEQALVRKAVGNLTLFSGGQQKKLDSAQKEARRLVMQATYYDGKAPAHAA